MEAVLSARPQRRFGSNQPYSDYIQFLCCQSFATLYDATDIPTALGLGEETTKNTEKESGVGGLPESALPDGAASQLSLALARYDQNCKLVCNCFFFSFFSTLDCARFCFL